MRRSSSPNIKPPISHSRSLPSALSEEHRPSSSGIFRRVVSDRLRQAVEGMMPEQQPQELDEATIVSPRKGGHSRRKSPKNVDLSSESGRDRASFKSPTRRPRNEDVARRNREDLVSPTKRRRQPLVDSRRSPRTSSWNTEAAEDLQQQQQQQPVRKSWAANSSPAAIVKTEDEEADPGNVGGVAEVQKTSRPIKQRAAGLFASLPTSFSFSGSEVREAAQSPPQRRKRTAREPCDSSQLLADIIMWRDLAKSALIFGIGSFFILSMSFTKDMQFNFVTLTSYAALIHLSIVFLRKNIIQKCEAPYTWALNEGTAVELTRGALPAVNSVLRKLSQLFSGDPAVTLKVAGVLWFLAQAGYRMSLWNLLSLAFFGAFTVPKLYATYSRQLQEHGNQVCSCLFSAWENCTHKKILGLMVVVGLWNLCSVSARLWLAFLSVVLFRKCQMPIAGAAETSPVVVKQEK